MCIIKSIYKKHNLMFLQVPRPKNSLSWPVKYYKQACKFFSRELIPNYTSQLWPSFPLLTCCSLRIKESHIDATIFICSCIYQNYVRTPQYPLSSSKVLRKKRTAPFYLQQKRTHWSLSLTFMEPVCSSHWEVSFRI